MTRAAEGATARAVNVTREGGVLDVMKDVCEPGGSRSDKPRKVVACSWDDYTAIQKGVTSMGLGDVLVQPNRYLDAGTAYVMDPPPEVIQ